MFSVKLKYARLSCVKAFPVANKIRGLTVLSALNILEFSVKKSARIIKKLLISAVANARFKNYNVESLFIDKICLDQASFLKRLRPCAKGRSSKILKRSCHILIVLAVKSTR